MAPSIYSLLFSHFNQSQNIILGLPTHIVLTISKSWKTTLNFCHNLVSNMTDKEYYGSLLWLPQRSPVQFCIFAYFLLYFLSIALMSSHSPNPQHLDTCTALHLNIHQNQLKNIFYINKYKWRRLMLITAIFTNACKFISPPTEEAASLFLFS